MNKKIIAYMVIVLVVLIAIFYVVKMPKNNVEQANQVQTPNVSIVNYFFNPEILTIQKGDTVVWMNQDGVSHQITGENFNSPLFNNGQSYSFTFDNIGTFDYNCAIHPFMTGTVVVQ